MAIILLVKHNCATCEYYAEFEGVCCNDENSAWVGSWPPTPEKACEFWEDKALHYHQEEFFRAERKKDLTKRQIKQVFVAGTAKS